MKCDMEEEIQKALEILKRGETLLYPTDTVWGIGCDARDSSAVQKIYSLKKRPDSKALICLVDGFAMLKEFIAEIPEEICEILSESDRPTTVIYRNPKGLAPNLVAEENTVGIRICNTPFCRELICRFGAPIVSTSANISGHPTAKTFHQIEPEIVKGVDYVVNLQQNETGEKEPSRILLLTEQKEIKILRA